MTYRASPELPRRRLGLALAVAAALTPAAAQRVPPADNGRYARAIAAGYKAAMYCSGIFTAGRAPAQIDADELSGIYPEYDRIVPTLMAQVDRELREVRVGFDPMLPARVAAWSRRDGCTTFPIGAEETATVVDNAGSQAGPLPADPRPWPAGDAAIKPQPSGALSGAVAAAFDGRSYGTGKTVGIVVLRDGAVIAEHYAAGWGPFVPNRTWSVGKSISGTLVGLATAAGKADVTKPATVPEWRSSPDDPRAGITLDQLLRMASGLHSGAAGNRTDAIYFGGTAVTEEATAWPLEAKPGTRFRYANDDVLLAVRSLRSTLGEQAYRDYPTTALFGPLGMAHTVAGKDPHGNFILSSQIWSTARDLARLGQFWLQDGVWQGRRLLPAGWMRYMTTPSGPQPADGPGYGATLWLFGPQQGVPAGSYAAQGNRGQDVMVVPSERLVVVRRGEDGGAARFDIARFTAAVIAGVHDRAGR